MADRDELAQLEAERDRLLSMIAYQNGPFYRTSLKFRMPALFVVVAIAIIFVVAALIVAGILAGQISASGLLFSVVGLALLAYILTRRITVFGSSFFSGEILLPLGDGIVARPPGEREAHQRLADCEARIMKLKEARP
jgi:membrane-associated HD superfamily phosphohydrolase